MSRQPNTEHAGVRGEKQKEIKDHFKSCWPSTWEDGVGTSQGEEKVWCRGDQSEIWDTHEIPK